jgi:hypothetical protein
MSEADRKTWLEQIEDGAMQAMHVPAGSAKSQAHKSVMDYYSDKHALQIAAKQNDDANCWINALLLRIKALEAELNMQRADEPVSMSDPPQADHQGGEGATPKGPVDQVIDALDKRVVPRSDRIRLRGALDAADTPLAGRAGADEALGRVTKLSASTNPLTARLIDAANDVWLLSR